MVESGLLAGKRQILMALAVLYTKEGAQFRVVQRRGQERCYYCSFCLTGFKGVVSIGRDWACTGHLLE